MKTNKILLGTLAGGVACFLLGWVIYGILMKDFMTTHYNQCMNKPETEMVWWALILSNLVWAMSYAVIISWANMATAAGGLKVGAVIGFLFMLSYDLSFYSMTNMYNELSTVAIDVIVGTVMSSIGGTVTGWAMSMGKKE